MNEPETSFSLLDWATLATLTVALVYTAGWSYAYHWFGAFNLGVIGLDIPAEYHFMYGFWALRRAWWLAGLYLVGVIVWIWPRPGGPPAWWITIGAWLRLAGVPVLPVAVLLLFVAAYQLGTSAAEGAYLRHHEQGFAAYPPVRIWLKPGATGQARLQRLAGQLRAADYRLLLQTKSAVYLLKPSAHAALPTVALRLSEVAAMRVLPVNPGRL